MKFYYKIALSVLICMMWGITLAQVPEKPAQPAPVVDLARIINNDSLTTALNAQLDSLSKKTQNQIVVVTVDDMGGLDGKEFATELGKKWGIGGKSLNNGFVMVVKPRNDKGAGEIGFATGYGLEGALPDVFCKRLQTEYMIPHFKDGDYAGGIKAAIDEIVPVVLNDYEQAQALAGNPAERAKKSGGGNGWLLIALAIGAIALLMFLRKRNKPAGSPTEQPQPDHLSSKQEEPEPASEKEEQEEVEETIEEEENDNNNGDNKPGASNANEPKPYKYGYGGGDFGGGGASTKF